MKGKKYSFALMIVRAYRLGYRQAGKASDFDSDIRRFESSYPIQFSFSIFNAQKNLKSKLVVS